MSGSSISFKITWHFKHTLGSCKYNFRIQDPHATVGTDYSDVQVPGLDHRYYIAILQIFSDSRHMFRTKPPR